MPKLSSTLPELSSGTPELSTTVRKSNVRANIYASHWEGVLVRSSISQTLSFSYFQNQGFGMAIKF